MKSQTKWMQISFLLHLLIIFIVINTVPPEAPANKPHIMGIRLDYKISKKSSQTLMIKQQQQLPIPPQKPASDTGMQNKKILENAPRKAPLTKSNIDRAVNNSRSNTEEDKYLSHIREIIQNNLAYPHLAKKMVLQGKVVVSFIISLDGEAQEIRIMESCGSEILDRSAIETVKRGSPFPKPPVQVALIIPVVYKLN